VPDKVSNIILSEQFVTRRWSTEIESRSCRSFDHAIASESSLIVTYLSTTATNPPRNLREHFTPPFTNERTHTKRQPSASPSLEARVVPTAQIATPPTFTGSRGDLRHSDTKLPEHPNCDADSCSGHLSRPLISSGEVPGLR
jgi:hypothetical protein